MFKAFKTELNPNNKQRTLFVKSAGCSRWAFNWGLALKKEALDKQELPPLAWTLSKQLVTLKRTTHPWLKEVSKWVPAEALKDLDRAFANFFARCKKKKAGQFSGKAGFPKFKVKGKGYKSFMVRDAQIFDGSVQLPRIGKVRLKEHGFIPTDQKVLSATVSLRAGRWFVSVLCELPDPVPMAKPKAVVGVDFGLKALATCSDGVAFENPKPLAKALKKMRRLQRQASRKQKGSNNRRKANMKVANLHFKIANTRNDALHKMTTQLTKTKSTVVVEDLNVAGMITNRKLARAISDTGLFEARRQLEYKSQRNGCSIVVADRWFPSSQLCSRCGTRKTDLTLGDRVFVCEACGLVIDRDLNAAINLKHWPSVSEKTDTARSAEIGEQSPTLVERKALASKQCDVKPCLVEARSEQQLARVVLVS